NADADATSVVSARDSSTVKPQPHQSVPLLSVSSLTVVAPIFVPPVEPGSRRRGWTGERPIGSVRPLRRSPTEPGRASSRGGPGPAARTARHLGAGRPHGRVQDGRPGVAGRRSAARGGRLPADAAGDAKAAAG